MASKIIATLWNLRSYYQPNAAAQRQAQREAAPLRFGAFEATYAPSGYAVKRPRTDKEAQRLYNHIRTVAFWLDAAPVLSDMGLPFRAGVGDIIGLVPIYGDILAGVLQLYQVWLCFVFGVPYTIIGYMIVNVLADTVVGIIPLIGDFIDNLFKSNLRNLALLETWLLTSAEASRYHILVMPETTDFLPKPSRAAKFGGSWFGGGKGTSEVEAEKERERVTGKVRKTRRMGRDEGVVGPVPVSTAGTETGVPLADPLD